MQASAMNQPVEKHLGAVRRMQPMPMQVFANAAPEQVPSKGFAAFVLSGHQEDELNNGDPPDLMLWGEE